MDAQVIFVLLQIFDVIAQHPDVFSDISPIVSEIRNEINAGQSEALNQYSLGMLNASRDVDVILLSEIHVVHRIINAVRLIPKELLPWS